MLVLPTLLILYLIPLGYQKILEKRNEQQYQAYLLKADSLVQAGWRPYQVGQARFPGTTSHSDSTKKRPAYQAPKKPGLNQMSFAEADSIVLQIVPGIGPTMAGRIVKFRENMGGLHQKEQILEVYGMTPETMEKLFDQFEFEPGISKKLKINELDANTLANHPYISYGEAKVIVAYRTQHGKYEKPEDLLGVKIFTKEWVDRLSPYLEF
jgi:DNA uptake protein ComE-like DNA-binding protein